MDHLARGSMKSVANYANPCETQVVHGTLTLLERKWRPYGFSVGPLSVEGPFSTYYLLRGVWCAFVRRHVNDIQYTRVVVRLQLDSIAVGNIAIYESIGMRSEIQSKQYGPRLERDYPLN